MSFFYHNTAASARNRRGKDRDTRPRTSSVSSNARRHKDTSKTQENQENKSSPPASPVIPSVPDTQQNLALDQLPSLPSSEATSPTLSSSGLRLNPSLASKGGIYHLSHEPYTPAALQQYLEKDVDDAEDAGEGNTNDCLYPSRAFANEPRSETTDTTLASEHSRVGVDTGQSTDRDDRTPLAVDPGFSRPETASTLPTRAKPDTYRKEGVQRSNRRYSAVRTDMEQKEHSGRLSKQTTSISDPGTQVEYYGVGSQTTQGRLKDLYQTRVQENTLPSGRDSSTDPEEASVTFLGSQERAQRSRRSSVLMSRTFTPPAPNFPMAPSPMRPEYVSPVPLRAEVSNESYQTYQQPQSHGGPVHPGVIPQHYPNHLNYSFFNGWNQPKYAQVPLEVSQATEMSASVPFLGNGLYSSSYMDKGESIASTVDLLHEFREALPSIEMLVKRAYIASQNSIASDSEKGYAGDVHKGLAEQKDARLEKIPRSRSVEKRRHPDDCNTRKKGIESRLQGRLGFRGELNTHRQFRDSLAAELNMLRRDIGEIIRNLRGKYLNDTINLSSMVDDLTNNIQAISKEGVDLHQSILAVCMAYQREQEIERITATQKCNDLERNRDREKAKAEDALQNLQEELLKLRRQDLTARESWEEERRAIAHEAEQQRHRVESEWSSKKDSIDQHWQTIVQTQADEHENALDQITASFESSTRQHQRDCHKLVTENDELRKELKRVQDAWEADKSRFSRVALDYRSTASNLHERDVN